jgi:hypothetical protein
LVLQHIQLDDDDDAVSGCKTGTLVPAHVVMNTTNKKSPRARYSGIQSAAIADAARVPNAVWTNRAWGSKNGWPVSQHQPRVRWWQHQRRPHGQILQFKAAQLWAILLGARLEVL